MNREFNLKDCTYEELTKLEEAIKAEKKNIYIDKCREYVRKLNKVLKEMEESGLGIEILAEDGGFISEFYFSTDNNSINALEYSY